jgi:hypothetical protein
MERRVGDDEYTTPFLVTWGWSPEYDDWPDLANDHFFASKSEALDFFERKNRPLLPVWIFEIGSYETAAGNQIEDWIAWWWNDAAMRGRRWKVRPPSDSKSGYASDAASQLVSYIPYLK